MKRKFHRSIIFSRTPLYSNFFFPGIFQIFPCDYKNAPFDKKGREFPLVIEYFTDEDEKIEVSEDLAEVGGYLSRTTVAQNYLNKLLRILTALTNHSFFTYKGKIKWGIALPEGEMSTEEEVEINKQSSRRILQTYYYPTISEDLKIFEFSERRHKKAEFIKHGTYYSDNPLDDSSKEIRFPLTIYKSLDAYFNLDKKATKVVNSVAHLINNGIDLRYNMKSLSFLSFVSAIETLVNFEYKDQKEAVTFECNDCQTIKTSSIHCQRCGRPIWGVKAKFKAFLKKHVAYSEEAERKFNKVYNLRSEIVHNGMLLLGDEEINWKKSQKEDSQWMTHLETMQMARLALVNWLIMNHKK